MFLKSYTRYFIALAIFIFVSQFVKGQNLVHNPSFEQVVACPDSLSELGPLHCAEWNNINSADYYNSCSLYPGLGVPSNIFGYQYAYEGVAYAGFFAYGSSNYREYAVGRIDAMQIGQLYTITIHLNRSSKCMYAINNFGVFFYNEGYYAFWNNNLQPMLTVTPQIQFNLQSPITDTLNWVTLTGTFLADSNYTHVIIGNFNDNQSTQITLVNPASTQNASYYYLDGVDVMQTMSATTSHTDNSCNGLNNGTASVMPAGGIEPYNYLWQPGNVTDSSLVGLSSGTYICRITDAAQDTILDTIVISEPPPVNPSIIIAANPGTDITLGQSVTFTAMPTDGGLNPAYQWMKNSLNISNATNSTYTTNNLSSGDIITCSIRSDAQCADSDNLYTSNPLTIHITTSISTVQSQLPIVIYPNPANNNITVTNLQVNDQILIYNVLGECVNSWVANKTQQTFDITSLTTGIYSVHIQDAMRNTKCVSRFLKN